MTSAPWESGARAHRYRRWPARCRDRGPGHRAIAVAEPPQPVRPARSRSAPDCPRGACCGAQHAVAFAVNWTSSHRASSVARCTITRSLPAEVDLVVRPLLLDPTSILRRSDSSACWPRRHLLGRLIPAVRPISLRSPHYCHPDCAPARLIEKASGCTLHEA